MLKKQLYMIRDDEDDDEYLSYHEDYGEISRLATPKDLTLERLADLLDHEAENCNAHDFVDSHRALAALLFQEVGRKTTTKIFIRLANYEGLHGMIGVCGIGNPDEVSKELGVPLATGLDEVWDLD